MSKLANHDQNHPRKYRVTITETLKRTVEVEAGDPHEAEQMVSDGWHDSKYVLGSEDFIDVEFEAVPVADSSPTNEGL